MEIIGAIVAVFKGLPVIKDIIEMFTGWFSKFAAWRKRLKFEKKRRRLDEAYIKAKKEKNTEDLQKEIEELL